MAKVRLKNIRKNPRRPIVLNLDRSTASLVIHRNRLEETRQGDRRVKMERVVIPRSIRIPFNGLSEPIDAKMLEAPEVAAALKAKKVAVVDDRPTLDERRKTKAEKRAAKAAKVKKSAPSEEAEGDTIKTTKGTSASRTTSASSKGRS